MTQPDKRPPRGAADAAGMSVVAKAARVMRVVEREGTASAATIAENLGEAVSTIYRLLGNLEKLGWITKADVRGQFRLGLPVLEIAQSVAEQLDVRQLARPLLEAMNRATDQTTYLCIRRGNVAVCIERVDGIGVQTLELPIGGSMALHRGAAPRAILAFEPQEFIDAYLDQIILEPTQPVSAGDRRRVARELQAIRDDGLAVSDGDITPGILSVGAPVFDHRGCVVASISVSGLRIRLAGENNPAGLVSDTARELTKLLGGST